MHLFFRSLTPFWHLKLYAAAIRPRVPCHRAKAGVRLMFGVLHNINPSYISTHIYCTLTPCSSWSIGKSNFLTRCDMVEPGLGTTNLLLLLLFLLLLKVADFSASAIPYFLQTNQFHSVQIKLIYDIFYY
jgi:hypothetical protein